MTAAADIAAAAAGKTSHCERSSRQHQADVIV